MSIFILAVRTIISQDVEADDMIYFSFDAEKVRKLVKERYFASFIEQPDRQRFVLLEGEIDGDPALAALSVKHVEDLTMGQPMTDAEKGAALLKITREFMAKQRIGCVEDISQCDRVIVNAYAFMEKLCNVVGYPEIDYD